MSYNVYEIFEIADNLEVAGAEFYKNAALKIDDDCDVKALLNELAALEEQHKSYFHSLKKRYNVEEIEGLIDLESQAGSYLKAIGESHIVHSLSDILNEEVLTPIRVLKIALDFEKDSVVFFSSLQSALKDEEEKAQVAQIVKEETEHVGMLTKKLKALYSV